MIRLEQLNKVKTAMSLLREVEAARLEDGDARAKTDAMNARCALTNIEDRLLLDLGIRTAATEGPRA